MEEILIGINGGIMINIDVSVKNVMNVWSPTTRNCENGKCLSSIMTDSAIMCDKIIKSYKEERNFNETKQPEKCKIFIF